MFIIAAQTPKNMVIATQESGGLFGDCGGYDDSAFVYGSNSKDLDCDHGLKEADSDNHC